MEDLPSYFSILNFQDLRDANVKELSKVFTNVWRSLPSVIPRHPLSVLGFSPLLPLPSPCRSSRGQRLFFLTMSSSISCESLLAISSRPLIMSVPLVARDEARNNEVLNDMFLLSVRMLPTLVASGTLLHPPPVTLLFSLSFAPAFRMPH